MGLTSLGRGPVRELRGRLRGRLLGGSHLLPDFLILGAARSGTTYLLGHLNAHPNVLPGPREPHFFDSHRYDYGLGWYRLRFPATSERDALRASGRRPALTGESSPSYLAEPEVPARVRAALPEARLIVLLRDPAARAASHWNWCLRQCGETRTFAEAVAAELGPADRPSALGHPRPVRSNDPLVVRRGLYQEQLERWHALFPREQLLVIQSERLFRDPLPVLAQVWAHLGLPEHAPAGRVMRNRNKPGTPYDEAVMTRLRDFYRPYDERLGAYLGMELDWA